MSVVVVVGAQWGDEGKGKVVDLLTEDVDVVARWAGGANAGHTIVVGDTQYVTHLMPSGILHPSCICVLGEGMVIDPRVLIEEIEQFKGHGLLSDPTKLVLSKRAHMTLPYHRILDGLREQGPAAVGSTKRGIGPTYESKAARTGLRIDDLFRPVRLRQRLEDNCRALEPLLGNSELPSVEEMAREYLAYGEQLSPYVGDASKFLGDQIAAGKRILLEGAQGVLLDLDHGTYPFVTSSSPTAGGACATLGIGPSRIDRVIGIVKAYATRVGLGPFPTELDDADAEALRTAGSEFGATTGRPRRCGWLDIPALRLATRVSGIQALAVTKLDVLSGMEELKLCVGYRFRGETIDEIPADPDDLAEVEPIYETWPGWPVDSKMAEGYAEGDGLEQLSEPARKYLARISELVQLPLALLSVGPGRNQTLMLERPYE